MKCRINRKWEVGWRAGGVVQVQVVPGLVSWFTYSSDFSRESSASSSNPQPH